MDGLLAEDAGQSCWSVLDDQLGAGLNLPARWSGHEALVDAVVVPLEVVYLQGLLVEVDPVAGGQDQPVLPPEDGGPVPLLGEALHVCGPPDVDDLLCRDQVWNSMTVSRAERG